MEMISRLVATFLVNALWQVALVAAAAALAARLMRSAPARYQHFVWLAALGLSFALPVASLRVAGGAAPENSRVAMGGVQENPLAVNSTGSALPAESSQMGPPTLNVGAAASHSAASGQPFRIPALAISIALARYVALGFLLFLLLRLAGFVRVWRRTQAVARSAHSQPLPSWAAELAERSRRAFGVGPVAILFSPEVRSPLTLGARRPSIVLPEGFLERADQDQLASALCHEMAHIARHDYLLNLVAELVYLPLAFHPAANLIRRRINETREFACDELAAGRLVRASDYARSLVAIAEALAVATQTSRLNYSLGVFDASNLEDRVMRLLNNRPRASAGVVKASLLATLALFGATCLSASVFSFTVRAAPEGGFAQGSDSAEHPDFSGRWNLDKSNSNLPSPSPEDLVETIDHRDPQMRIVTSSKDWSDSEPIAKTLFALMIPEVSTTTDNRDNTAKFGPGELKSKTRWEGKSLVTEWELERDGQREMEGTWTRSLSADGKTLTLRVVAGEPGGGMQGTAKLVFVKDTSSGGSPESFVGTWQAKFEGATYIVVSLRAAGARKAEFQGKEYALSKNGEGFAGMVSLGNFGVDENGQVNHVEDEPNPDYAEPIISSRPEGDTLSLVERSKSGVDNSFQMKVGGADEAKIKWMPSAHAPFAPEPGWWTITRTLAKAENEETLGGPSAGVVGGVPGGVSGGVVGPSRRIAGEVKGSISSKVSEPTGKEEASKLTGTVSDPSGGRIAHAVVSLIGQVGSFNWAGATDENGEFACERVPEGSYLLLVRYPKFGGAEALVSVPGTEREVHINVMMSPARVMESAIVTARRQGAGAKTPVTSAPRRILVGGQVEQAQLLYKPQPEYPESARSRSIEGTVVMQAVISIEGLPLSLKIIQSPDEALSKAATDAVKQWRYQPTKLNGLPVEVVTDITVRFTLEN